METVIAFFSSDSRKLYQYDVFQALALPKGYVIHFRYRSSLIQDDIFANLAAVKGNKGVIFYTVGNTSDNNGKIDDSRLKHICIREVIIKNVEHDKEYTENVNFYLELGDFKKYEIKDKQELLPNSKYVSRINTICNSNIKWVDVIDTVKHHFDQKLFFNLRSIRNSCGETLTPTFDKDNKAYYDLDEEKNYLMDISYYDLSDSQSDISIEPNHGVISINYHENYKVNTIKDTDTINFMVHSLNVTKIRTMINFVINNDSQKSYYQLNVNVRRQKNKPLIFGILTALSSAGLFIGQYAAKVSNTMKVASGWIALASVILGFSAYMIYDKLNKK
jgi:hypothetical protein